MKFDLYDLQDEKTIVKYLEENYPSALREMLSFEYEIDRAIHESRLIAKLTRSNDNIDYLKNFAVLSGIEKKHIIRNLMRTIKAFNSYKSQKNNNINNKMVRAIASYYGKTATINPKILKLCKQRLENLINCFNQFDVDLDLSSKMQYKK